ncbi:hypothetical protein CIB48_g360 [Xylaria polymorpha]|nr:hypothetical protein CIB48_g360 [Xylaria polymorpha]
MLNTLAVKWYLGLEISGLRQGEDSEQARRLRTHDLSRHISISSRLRAVLSQGRLRPAPGIGELPISAYYLLCLSISKRRTLFVRYRLTHVAPALFPSEDHTAHWRRPSMATIKPIEAKTVIVDLCSVVKELVENSIDAGATNIDVRFKNQGLDAIEVQDNGSGISKENYDTLALKHYTSKLSTYSDLESLETFGFRGEALSSLCALSKFSVTTCLASDAPKGSRLEFETSGKLHSTNVVAAQKGTTVLVEGLFHNLPVRRRELERNIKREWNKVLGVLNQYACIQTGLKFSVSQQPNKGKRMVLFSTKGNQTTRENIVNVFGAKTLTVLIPLDLELELEPTNTSSQRLIARGDSQAKIIRVRGHVSRPAHGEGRQTPDRQMFFVNGRPCGLPQFAKVFNEVYKSYNASQSPFIFADIQLDTHLYDVNVSPDKRTILLHDQTRMLDNLRESLSALFESQDYALPAAQFQTPKQSLLKRPSGGRQDTPSSEAITKRLASIDSVSPHRTKLYSY